MDRVEVAHAANQKPLKATASKLAGRIRTAPIAARTAGTERIEAAAAPPTEARKSALLLQIQG